LNELKKLARPDNYSDEFEGYFPRAKRIPVKSHTPPEEKSTSRSSGGGYSRPKMSRDVNKDASKVVSIHATTQLQVVLVKPDRFESAPEIADHLCEKRTVVLNLEQTKKEIARRLLDFLSGISYAQEGKIKKVAVSTYIITPYNVDIMGDLIDELENNGLYF